MKKILPLIGLTTLAVGAVVGVSSLKTQAKEAKGVLDTVEWDYLAIDNNNWQVIDSNDPDGDQANEFRDMGKWVEARTDSSFFSARSYNALDNFYNGYRNENWTGKIRSAKWMQTTDYVTFTLSGAGNANVGMKIYAASDSTTPIATISANDYFSDARLCLNMIVRVANVSAHKNELLYAELVDDQTGGFGAVGMGAFKVSQTADDVARTLSVHKNHLSRRDNGKNDGTQDNDARAREYALNIYNTEAEYSAFKSIVLDNADMDFEDYDQCTNLALDNSTVTGFADRDPGFDWINWGYGEAYNLADYWDWDERMPFNKQEDAFFKGNYGGDGAKYTLLTNDFKFSGKGYFSIKLAGNGTKVALIDASTGAELVSATNTNYKDGDKWNVPQNKTYTCTMTRYIIDAREHLNKMVRIAISDNSTAGWSILMFDELITKYTSDPEFILDTYTQTPKDQTIRYGIVPSVLVQTTEDYIKEAYDFVTNYYSVFRAEGSFKYLQCSGFTAEELQDLCDDYTDLSAEAKAIVDNTADYDRGNVAGDYYFLPINTSNKVGTVVSSIITKNNLTHSPAAVPTNSLFAKANDNAGLIIVIGVSAITLLGFAFLFLKKKKQEN